MGVGTNGSEDMEWICRLGPALRPDATGQLSPAVGAAVISDAIERIGEAPVRWGIVVAAEMTRAVFAQMPELPQGPEVFEEARAGSEANVLAVIETLARGTDEAAQMPADAVEFARRSVRRGIPLQAILRGYRLGHEYLVSALQETIAALVDGRPVGAMQRALRVTFRYVDAGVETLIGEYESEREHWARTAVARRAETVRAILAGDGVDAADAGAVLGYPLERTHVAAVLWANGAAAADQVLERAASALAARLSASPPLLIPRDGQTIWMWAIADRRAAARAAPLADALGASVRAAVGEPESGPDGFRRSHEAAREVARIARLGGDEGPVVLGWEDVGLVSLVTTDLDRARSFVRHALGPLADPGASELRETVRSFLAHRGSHTGAARALYVHRNTVAYRLAQAEELLGRPIGERELELRVSLEVAAMLGGAVLPGPER